MLSEINLEDIEKELENRLKLLKLRVNTQLDILLYSSSSLLKRYGSGEIGNAEFDKMYDILEFAAERALSGITLPEDSAIKRYLKDHRKVIYEIKEKLR